MKVGRLAVILNIVNGIQHIKNYEVLIHSTSVR